MHPRQILSLGNFFSAAHFFLLIYIVGPYLATFMDDTQTGLVISLGAVLTLIVFPYMPRLVRTYGAKRLAIGLSFLQAVVLTILAGSPSPLIAIGAVAVACAISPLIAYQLDLLLEATVSGESATGRIRTAFLTAANAALVLAPFAVGWLLNGHDRYDIVFLAAAISLTPFIMLLLVEKLPEGAPPHLARLRATGTCMLRNADLRAVSIAQGVLQLFFHLAPLYVQLYLHHVLGMPWSDLGWVFAVALFPFLILQYPAGWLADKYIGDKELLITGFFIMGCSFALFVFVTASTPLLLILLMLLGTRIGAALCEAMVEGHFFRRVSERDANTVGAFRMMRPVGALIAPLLGSAILMVGSYGVLFVGAGAAIAIFGMLAALSMHDVR